MDQTAVIENERRREKRTYEFRRKIDFVYTAIRSCACCRTSLPPVDLLCEICWRELSRFVNRGERLKQPGYPFPVYSLFSWTPANEDYIRPIIYGFKGGRAVRAAEKLADLFLSERAASADLLLSAPSRTFDHSKLWMHVLGKRFPCQVISPFRERNSRRQKELSQEERASRRFEIREQFAGSPLAPESAKRIVFADDVITTGSTALAAYMALGDPEGFEVWTLASRPRLATASSAW